MAFCKVGGKNNIARYQEFFKAFEARVCVISDLDCVLEGFEQLDPSEKCKNTRDKLFGLVDEFAESQKVEGRISSKEIKEMQGSKVRQNQLKSLMETIGKHKKGEATEEEVNKAQEAFFTDLVANKRRQVLEDSSTPEIIKLKRELLEQLRELDVFVLERGTIEKYYPKEVTGPDKPSKAMDFCSRVQTREDLLRLCDVVVGTEMNDVNKEFSVILSSIYEVE